MGTGQTPEMRRKALEMLRSGGKGASKQVRELLGLLLFEDVLLDWSKCSCYSWTNTGLCRILVSESMTFGATITMPERKLVRIQEKGQVTIPTELRKKLGLKKGDLVAVTETPEGVLITPQEVLAMKALDRIGEVLKERGLSLEELIESGREIRGQIVKEQYGIEPDKEG